MIRLGATDPPTFFSITSRYRIYILNICCERNNGKSNHSVRVCTLAKLRIPCSWLRGLQSSLVLKSALVNLNQFRYLGLAKSIKNWPATYFAVSESTLPTKAVKEGRPSEPGAGWITSAPEENMHSVPDDEGLGKYTYPSPRLDRQDPSGRLQKMDQEWCWFHPIWHWSYHVRHMR